MHKSISFGDIQVVLCGDAGWRFWTLGSCWWWLDDYQCETRYSPAYAQTQVSYLKIGNLIWLITHATIFAIVNSGRANEDCGWQHSMVYPYVITILHASDTMGSIVIHSLVRHSDPINNTFITFVLDSSNIFNFVFYYKYYIVELWIYEPLASMYVSNNIYTYMAF